MLTWQFASPEEYIPVCELFRNSELGKDKSLPDIQRRITIPLLLRHLITIYQDRKLCGFTTFAYLSDEAEKHMPTEGIQPRDWLSGRNFWVVDLVANGDGYKMMRLVARGLGLRKWRYFRDKHQEIREIKS